MKKLAVDANILISAFIRGRARKILLHNRNTTQFITTKIKIEEVRRNLPKIASKRGLDLHALYEALIILPIEIFLPEHYAEQMEESNKRIGKRDPTDADLLALALTEDCPVWSEDKDFKDSKIKVYTTEMMIDKLKLNH